MIIDNFQHGNEKHLRYFIELPNRTVAFQMSKVIVSINHREFSTVVRMLILMYIVQSCLPDRHHRSIILFKNFKRK